MTQAIYPALSLQVELGENLKSKKNTSLFARAKNILTGRVFENWREQLLSVTTVYYIIKAAASFFAGAWIFALIELSTAGFAAVMRKEIADFTNLHKATKSYREQNMEFALNNLDLRSTVTEFKDEVQKLKGESAKFESSNLEYEFNNQQHEKLLGILGNTTKNLGTEIRTAIKSGGKLSHKILVKFLEGVQLFDEQKGVLKVLQTEMTKESKKTLARFETLSKQVGEMNIRGVQALHEANDELQKTLREISAAEARAVSLKQEIVHLKQVRKGLQKDAGRISGVVDDLEGASAKITHSADMVMNLFTSFFGGTNPSSGKFEVEGTKVFMVIAGMALIANAFFPGKASKISQLVLS